jgi:hypothetical protein
MQNHLIRLQLHTSGFPAPTPCGGFSIRDGINLDDPFIDEPGEPTKSGEEVAGLFDPKGPPPFGAALRALARRITRGARPRRATNNSNRVPEPSGRYPSRRDSNPEPSRGDE